MQSMPESSVEPLVNGNNGGGGGGGGGAGAGAGGYSEEGTEYQSLEQSCFYETGHPDFYPLHEPKYHRPMQQTPKSLCLG